MKKLLDLIENLKNSEIKKQVDKRVSEFKKIIKQNNKNKLFTELCFCILTANSSAEKCIEIQDKIGNKFLNLNEKKLAERLKQLGYRFPNVRARYIVEARKYNFNVINSIKNEHELREWLVQNIKGLGMKEASHFLRNIGFSNIAIIDFHIIDILEKYNIIKKQGTLTRKKYLEIEQKLRKIAKKTNLNLSELDLYLWYVETGKVLK